MKKIILSGFFAYAALSCVIPIIPSYAESLGASPFLSAVAAGIFALSPAIAMTPFGMMSEIYGRRTFIVAGMITSAVAPLLYMLSTNPYMLITARLVHGFGSAMYIPAVNAMVADSAVADRRGEAIGLLSASLMLGFFAGPAVGGIVAELYGVTSTFILSFIFALLGLLSVVTAPRVGARHLTNAADLPKEMLPFFAVMFFGTGTTSALALYAIPMHPELTEFQIGVIVSALFLFSAIFRVPAGILSDRIGRKSSAAIGMVVTSVGLLLSATANSVQLFIASSVCGVGMGIVNTSVFAAASDCENRGFAMGLANTTLNAGIFCGSAVAGYLAGFMDFSTMMLYLSAVNALALPMLFYDNFLSLKEK